SGVSEVTTIAEPRQELAREARNIVPGAEILAVPEQIFESDLDGIVIATPRALHASQTEQALRSGKAVFCQKPLGRNAAETRRLVLSAREADRLLGVDFSYRYISGVKRMHDLCRAGDLGHIYAVDLVFHNAYGPD